MVYVLNGTSVDKSISVVRSRFEFLRRLNPFMELAVFLSRQVDSNQLTRLSSELHMVVTPFCTLSSDGNSLNVEGVLSALCQVMLLSNTDNEGADAIAAEHLIALLQDVRACKGGSQLWSTAHQLYLHVSEEEHCNHEQTNSAPLSHALGRFDGAVQFLVERHMAVRRHGAHSSRFGIWYEDGNANRFYFCEPVLGREVAVRLPVSDRVLSNVLQDRQSAKFWGASQIDDATVQFLEDAIAKETNVQVLLVLLDDWQLARPRANVFPKTLQQELLNCVTWEKRYDGDWKWIKVHFV